MSNTEMMDAQAPAAPLTPAQKRADLLAKAQGMKTVADAKVATIVTAAPVEGDGTTKVKPEGSPRSQKARGVPEGYKTTVLPVDFAPDTHKVLLSAAKQRNLTMPALLNKYIKEGIMADWNLLVEDAKKYDATKTEKGDSATVTKLTTMTEEQRIAYIRGEQEKVVAILIRAGIPEAAARAQVFGAVAEAASAITGNAVGENAASE